jgi:hypothetical protein
VGLAVVLILLFATGQLQADDNWKGYVAADVRAFFTSPEFSGQDNNPQFSIALEPEFNLDLKRDGESFTFKPFVRLDSIDSERSHLDIRELNWQKAKGRWELVVGIDKVFWGVTESQHLVDIVNQTDQVENPDGEDKLGQPMVRISLIRDWGIVDFFVLPGFRERTFPGREGRLRPGIEVADKALYESSEGDRHVDFAARWSHVVGPIDLGVSHFKGTSREPDLVPLARLNGDLSLSAFYPQIDQTGLDLQATLSNWLLKLESIHRSGQGESFTAATTGFEYSFWGAFGSNIDVGAVVEYLWDDRGESGSSPFQDDLFIGTRFGFNDVQSSEILAGTILDRDNSSALYLIEASRRIGANWKIEAEVRAFTGAPPTDPLASIQVDDYFQLSIQRHF